jgi:hypothetical protein
VAKNKVFFEPIVCPQNQQYVKAPQKKRRTSSFVGASIKPKFEEESEGQQLKKFEVCIDIGDVISCQLRQFYNETGQYVRELSDAKHYMYDFFL